jgi:hypothetical protein
LYSFDLKIDSDYQFWLKETLNCNDIVYIVIGGVINVGGAHALGGPIAFYGQPVRNSIDLAVK